MQKDNDDELLTYASADMGDLEEHASDPNGRSEITIRRGADYDAEEMRQSCRDM